MSAHNGKTVRCYHDSDDDSDSTDAEPTTLTFEDHGRYVKSPRGEDRHGTALRDRFQQSALRFDCPDCGTTHWACPVCTEPADSDDNTAPGWFRGESTGESLACHNCNQKEAARQMRGMR